MTKQEVGNTRWRLQTGSPKSPFLSLNTKQERDLNGFTDVFGMQLSDGTGCDAVRPNRKGKYKMVASKIRIHSPELRDRIYEIPKAAPIFSLSSYPMAIVSILNGQTGTSNSKSASAIPKLHMFHLVDMKARRFQRLYVSVTDTSTKLVPSKRTP